MITITFPASTVNRFYLEVWSDQKKVKGLRLGQAFHQYMKLDKLSDDKVPADGRISENKAWLDRLYQADGDKARIMIEGRTDYNN